MIDRPPLLVIALLWAAGCTTGAGAKVPLSSLRDLSASLDLMRVSGGCYQMGAPEDDCDATPDERPSHEVCVGSFLIGKFEVTRGLWRAVMGGEGPSSSTCRRDDCPANDMTWGEVQEFLGRLNALTGGHRYRLPTEAEWEYAARSGGRDERFPGGRLVGDVSWYADNSGRANHPVGTKAPNGLGLHDMAGNVWEMTSDWYGATYYAVSPRDAPSGPASGDDHAVRGGSRAEGVPSQRTTRRASIGDRTEGAGRGGNVGFRILMEP